LNEKEKTFLEKSKEALKKKKKKKKKFF